MKTSFSDQELRLFAMGDQVIAVDVDHVNLHDLLDAMPGGIVRFRRNPNDANFGGMESAGCIAGWISEDA